jgi:nucleoid-associated protein YgaU
MKLTPWLVLLSLSLASCSGSKSAQKIDESTPQIELSDADEFIENDEASIVDGSQDPISDDSMVSDNAFPETTITETAPEPVVTDKPYTSVTATSYEAGTMKQYVVQKNETLMLIAFKLYGDYERWKELANQNRDTLKGNNNISAGMTLNYLAPAEEFVWNPQGLPYLIRTGDTLGGISQQVYSHSKKWKSIWDNNRPLIKDPNKIYSGFTIYYLENGREVANEI